MSEPEKRDHWAALADSMGIQPPPQEEKPVQPETEPVAAQEPAPAFSPPPVARKVVAPRRAAADWGQLAAELGLAPPPPSPPAAVPVIKEPRVERAPAEPVIERAVAETDTSPVDLEAEEEARVRAEAWQSELVEVSDPVFLDTTDAEEGHLEPIETADQDDALAESSETAAEQDEQTAPSEQRERRRRRKKRRRRRTGDGPARTEDASPLASESGASQSVAADAGPAEQYLEEVLGGESAEETETESELQSGSSAEGERRDGRKRRRRRRKKRSVETAPDAAESQPAESDEPVDAEGETWNEPDAEHDDLEHDHDSDVEGEEASGRLSHRAIPTWDQAIGLIIARNMEARAKHPNGPARRGGKGRRPDRGRS